MKYFQNKAPIGKRGYRFGEKACMYHYQKEKIEIGSIVSGVESRIMKKREFRPKRYNKATGCWIVKFCNQF